MDDLYRENIIDHFKNPRNFGRLENPDLTYEDSNPLCGDIIRIDLKINNGTISEVGFEGKGCAISIASASILTELIKDKSVDLLKEFDKEELLENLGITLSPIRLKCALLSLKVFKAGLYGLKS